MYYLFYEYKNVAKKVSPLLSKKVSPLLSKKVSPLLIELYPKICPIWGVQFIVRELTSLAFVYII